MRSNKTNYIFLGLLCLSYFIELNISYAYKNIKSEDISSVELENSAEIFGAETDSQHEISIIDTAYFIKSVDAAIATFKDIYDDLPGDMSNAEIRLVNCTSIDCGSGNGNDIIGDYKIAKIASIKDETHLFRVHLLKSGVLRGKNKKRLEVLGRYPSEIGGYFSIKSFDGKTNFPLSLKEANFSEGTYLILSDKNNEDSFSPSLTPAEAFKIDKKMDDGFPLTGSITAAGDQKCILKIEDKYEYNTDQKNSLESKCLFLIAKLNYR